MFYRLKKSYVLRGWEKMAWALVERPKNDVRVISKEMFQVLLLCDGETNLDEGILDGVLEKELEKCEEEGIIEASLESSPLEPDQYYKYYNNRYVKLVFWSITGKCNYQCRHCYMDAPDAIYGQLSIEEALDFVDQMAACGVLRVEITGGEPLVRKDIWQIIDRILGYKMVIGTFYSNGWLLNESVLDEFEKRNIKPQISISFDGVGWHDWMRGTRGAEDAALRALKLCKERGFNTDVQMCLHKGNIDSLPQTIDALHAVGVEKLKVSNIVLTDLWRRNSEGYALSQEEYLEAMIDYIPKYIKAGKPLNLLTLSGIIHIYDDKPYELAIREYDGTEETLGCFLCSITRWYCYITPEGRLLPCLPMTSIPSSDQERFPKIQDIGLKKGLNDSFNMQFVNMQVRDLLEANEECRDCPYKLKCGGGCRAIALMDGTHNLMGCDRNMCIFWKGGYAERIRQAVEVILN